MTPEDHSPLGEDRLALLVELMAHQRAKLGALMKGERVEGAADFARSTNCFSHLWQPGRLWETRGFAPPLHRGFALNKDDTERLAH